MEAAHEKVNFLVTIFHGAAAPLRGSAAIKSACVLMAWRSGRQWDIAPGQ